MSWESFRSQAGDWEKTWFLLRAKCIHAGSGCSMAAISGGYCVSPSGVRCPKYRPRLTLAAGFFSSDLKSI